jgi:DNA-binding response OmpR family regulator
LKSSWTGARLRCLFVEKGFRLNSLKFRKPTMLQSLLLNVDDNQGARYAKTRLLRNAGFQVEEATDGADALEMAMRLQPSLMILDVKLPDMSGLDVCQHIKTNAATAHILVLQTSAALISANDHSRGLHSGADHYLAAPFEPNDLVRHVRTLLGQHRPSCIAEVQATPGAVI